jgi:predicted CxxxxCH...CXXCH cytochrome family protein
MRYERNCGRFTGLILVAALVALVVGLGLPDRANAYYLLGSTAGNATSNGSTNDSRGWLVTTPTRSYMQVVKVGWRGGTNGGIRMGIYDGNTAGANLLADFGAMTYSGSGSYQEFTVPTPYSLPSNTSLCIVMKTDTAVGYYNGTTSGLTGGIRAFDSSGSTSAFASTMPSVSTTSRLYDYYVAWDVVPNIGSMNDTTLNPSQTGVIITGGGFENQNEFGAGTSHVYLATGSTWASHGTMTEQTVTSWPNDGGGSSSTVTFTVVQGSLSYGTNYVYVMNSDGETNANGYAIDLQSLSNPATTTGTLSTTGITDTSVSLQATYTGDDSPNNNNVCIMQYKESTAGTWLDITNESKNEPSKLWTGSVSGLKPGTSYDFQATFTDTNGVSGTNPLTLTTSTTYQALGVGTLSTGTVTDNSIVVNAPVDSASDTNNGATVQYQYNDGSGWTNSGSAVAAKSNQSRTINGLTPGTSYNFRVIWTDSDGVYDMTSKASLGSPYTTDGSLSQSTSNNSTTVGALTRTARTATTIDLSAAFTGDNNTNNSVLFEYRLSPSGSWVTTGVGTPVLGSGKWTVQITGLTELTTYDFRATFTDTDGIYGTNPATLTDSTPTACDAVVNDCMDCHAMPPSAGSHDVTAHKGDSTRYACAVCHFNYAQMANVTSTTKWTVSHENGKLDIYTSNHINNGIKGGYYLGYRNSSTLWEGKSPANSNNTCDNTYCHGSSSPIWGTTGSLTCTSCHAKPPTDVGSHAKHSQGYVGYRDNSNTSNYDYGCFKCHPEAQHAQGPATGTSAAYVAFSDISSPTPMNGTYNVGSLLGTDSAGRNVSAATCNNYCHSDGNGGAAAVTPTWGTPITNCTSCHGDKTTISSGSHQEHVNVANIGIFGCRDCHSATVSSDTTISDRSKHVNGTKDVSMVRGGSINGSNICSNTRCHSTGQAGAPSPVDSPAWGSTITCDGCHGAEGTSLVDGAPEYANVSTASRTQFNGHWVPGHVSTSADCNKCHSQTVDTNLNILGKHLNYTTNVSFALGGTYANKRCSGTDASNCHGTSVTPRWGGTLACQDCHLNTGAIGTETDDWTYGNGTKATINFSEFTSVGHGRIGAYRYTGNPGANLTCTNCHDPNVQHGTATDPFRLISSATRHPSDPNTICLDCHNGTTAVLEANHDLAHVGQGTWSWTPKCVDCHDPHGDNGGMTTSWYNAAMIQSEPATSGSNTYGAPLGTTPTDFPFDRGASITWNSFVDNANPKPYNGICQVCHTLGEYFDQNTYTSSHNPGQPCTNCHSHPTGFQPSGACVDCHKTGGAGTLAGKRDAQIDFSMNSHHINAAWANISKISCTACHAEGNYSDGSTTSYHKDGIVELKQWSNTVAFPSSGSNGTFTVVTYSNGTTIKANALCLSCHNAHNASATPFSDSGDSGTPSTYDTASGGTNAGSIDVRYSATNTTYFSKYDPNTYNVVPQIVKAYSPHGNAANNQRGVATTGAWANDGGNTNVACLDCHNSHGSDTGSGGTSTSYSSSVGGYGAGILKETSTYTPTAGSGSPVSWSASADLCWDCHLGDEDGPKTYANFGNNAPIRGYYDPGRWRSTDTWTPSFTYKTAGSGNGAGSQKGGHFGASSALTTTTATAISGRCVECHDPHGVNPSKTDAQYMVPALKGTWLTSPYKEDRAGGNLPGGTSNAQDALNTRTPSGYRNRPATRENPRFDYNNPPIVGAGYGTGTGPGWGTGSNGWNGYFIDDNTFGTNLTYGSGGSVVDVSNPSSSVHTWIPTSVNRITETTAQFAGLCLSCHTNTAPGGAVDSIREVSDTTTTPTIHVHRTVKGWDTDYAAADIFTTAMTYEHIMGVVHTRSNGSVCSGSSTASALPGGYRWSVDPSIQSTAGNTQNMHAFPCSKCHAAHTSKLPRLMKTNCMDVGSGTTPKHNSTYTMPINCKPSSSNGVPLPLTCHNYGKSNVSGSTRGWNSKTGW